MVFVEQIAEDTVSTLFERIDAYIEENIDGNNVLLINGIPYGINKTVFNDFFVNEGLEEYVDIDIDTDPRAYSLDFRMLYNYIFIDWLRIAHSKDVEINGHVEFGPLFEIRLTINALWFELYEYVQPIYF